MEVKDIDSLSALYAQAFDDNTCYNYIFQYDKETEPENYFASKKWLFEKRLAINLEYEFPVYVAL